MNFNETFTDAERDRTFEAATALGLDGFSSSTVLSEAKRLVPFVERHKMYVAMHNHNNLTDPDQFAKPESFERALDMSPWFRATLDIGHFVAGNNDPVSFIEKHHDRIVNIHVRDRKRNNGRNMPFGQGDTPIREVPRLIRTGSIRSGVISNTSMRREERVAESADGHAAVFRLHGRADFGIWPLMEYKTGRVTFRSGHELRRKTTLTPNATFGD